MFENFEIGSIVVNPIYIAVIVSLLISYLLIWDAEDKKELYLLWLKTLILFYVVYKLSFLLFNPEGYMHILYASGGPEGVLLGLFISYIYLAYKTDRLYFVESYIFWAMSFLVLYNYFEFQTLTQWPYLIMMLLVLIGVITMYFLSHRFMKILTIFVVSVILQLVIRAFIYNGEIVFGLSVVEWWLIISLLYVIVMTFRGLRNEVGDAVEDK